MDQVTYNIYYITETVFRTEKASMNGDLKEVRKEVLKEI
jgi:hypothetical protein